MNHYFPKMPTRCRQTMTDGVRTGAGAGAIPGPQVLLDRSPPDDLER